MSEEKKFRFAAKKVFLTYPQCGDLQPSVLLSFLNQKGFIVRYVIGREKHEDGGFHLHAVVEYSTKIQTRDERFFDLENFHPNVQPVRSWDNAAAYCSKDGDFITGAKFNDSDPTNFTKRKEDWDAWSNHHSEKRLEEVKWPIRLMDGAEWTPIGLGKKRHLWIVGNPDAGKTTWIQNTFENQKVYIRQNTKYPYDTYNGETVLIYDDFFPKFEEIASASITYKIKSPVYGDTRYRTRYWPLNKDIVMIVLANSPPSYGVHQTAIESRFNVMFV